MKIIIFIIAVGILIWVIEDLLYSQNKSHLQFAKECFLPRKRFLLETRNVLLVVLVASILILAVIVECFRKKAS